MVTMTPEQLMALPPEYMAEVNPNAHQLFNTSVGFIVVDTVILILFIISTRMAREPSPVELYFLIPVGYLTVIGNALIGILLVQIGGLGRHFAYYILNDPQTIKRYLKLQTGVELIYMASITFPKIALLTLYLRIFVDRVARALTWIMIGVLVMFFISGLGLGLGLCRPYAFKWDKTINGTCGDIMAGYRWMSIPSITTDVFILLIPIPTIWKLQLSKLKKIGVLFTFLVGGLGIITAIVRCLTFYKSDLFSDPTYLAGGTMVWTVVEPSAYFICACLPRLRLILAWFFKRTGLEKIYKRTSSTTLPNNPSSNITVGRYKKSGKPTTSTFESANSDDVGFLQLDDLEFDQQEAKKARDTRDQSSQIV